MSLPGVLIDSEGMVSAMIALGNQMQIIYRVVASILIDVVNIMFRRDRSIMELPDVAMEHCSSTLGLSVIAVIAKCVTKSIKSHEWQWCRPVAEFPASRLQQFMNRLARYAERL